MASLSHLCENVGQLFTLLLATDVCSQTGFAELQRTLIFADLQQFHASFLVWSVTNDFTDQVAYEFGVLGLNLPTKKEMEIGSLTWH